MIRKVTYRIHMTLFCSVIHYTDTALKVSIVKLMQEYRFINLDQQTSFLLSTSSVLVHHVNNEN